MNGSIKGIKYVSLGPHCGYGAAAKSLMMGLRRMGIPVSWTPMVPGDGWGIGFEPYLGRATSDADLAPLCNKPIAYDTVILHTVPEWYPPWIAGEPNKRIIGSTVWEADKLPSHWPRVLNAVDRVQVPCRWNKKVFAECGVTTPVDVIPYVASDREPPRSSCRPLGIPAEDYVFYTIGTWTGRKAIEKTIQSYLAAFTARDRATLAVKTTRRDLARPFLNRLIVSTRWRVKQIRRRYRSPARIKVIDRDIGSEEMLRLHGRGDCYVSLTRSEGWGLGAFDAAAYAKPVIMTAFGGQLDFLPEDLALLVRYDLVAARGVGWESSVFTSGQHWAEPSVEHGAELMRWAFENREEASARGRALRAYVRRHYCEEVVMKQMLRSIRET